MTGYIEFQGSGRYQITAAVAVGGNDTTKHMVFLIDTVTGRSWRYAGSPGEWRAVDFQEDAVPAPLGAHEAPLPLEAGDA